MGGPASKITEVKGVSVGDSKKHSKPGKWSRMAGEVAHKEGQN